MKKRRLKRWVKVLITIVLVALMMFAYSNSIRLGENATNGGIEAIKCVLIWTFLFTTPFSICGIWGE